MLLYETEATQNRLSDYIFQERNHIQRLFFMEVINTSEYCQKIQENLWVKKKLNENREFSSPIESLSYHFENQQPVFLIKICCFVSQKVCQAGFKRKMMGTSIFFEKYCVKIDKFCIIYCIFYFFFFFTAHIRII